MKPLALSFCLLIAVLPCGESEVSAEQVTIQYQATVKTVVNSFLGYTVAMDTPVSGVFIFDTSLPDSNVSDINRGRYLHAGTGGFTAQFQALDGSNPVAITIHGSGSPRVDVEWFPSFNDTWRYSDGMPNYGTMTVNGSPNADVDLGFSMSQAVFFASDANTNPWPLATFPSVTNHTFVLEDSNGRILLGITSATVVPEPVTLAIGLPLLMSGCLSRRRMARHA